MFEQIYDDLRHELPDRFIMKMSDDCERIAVMLGDLQGGLVINSKKQARAVLRMVRLIKRAGFLNEATGDS